MSGRPRYTLEGVFPTGNFGPLTVGKLLSRPAEDSKSFTTVFFCDDSSTSVLKEVYDIANHYFQLSEKKKPEPFEGGSLILTSWHKQLVFPTDLPAGMGSWPMRSGKLEADCQWYISKAFPHSIGFGEVDYSDTEVEIEVTWMYGELQYKNLMGF